ncbi:hypothetical protein Y886_07705 [Xanthomonas hyacinthi DSM 19077]|nr:hypothetical protein Y886_07705 [Xanthomonas hyacinthi DSM 19077]
MTSNLQTILEQSSDLQNLVEASDADTDFDFQRYTPLFQAVASSSLVRDIIQFHIEQIATNASYTPGKFVISGDVHGTTFFENKHFTMAIGYRSTDKRLKATENGRGNRILVNAFDHFSSIIKLNGIGEWTRYDVPAFSDLEPLEPEAEMTIIEKGRFKEGQHFFLPAGRSAFTLDHFHGNAIYLDITGNTSKFHCTPIFDRDTLKLVGITAGNRVSARIEILTKALTCLEHTPALPILEELANHSHHFVRWNSIRHAICLDGLFGLHLAQKAVNDPHPHVSQAASQTVAYLAPLLEGTSYAN